MVQTTILDIYGFDFTKMPPGWDYFSGLDPLTEHNKQLWENRSLAEWQVLRDKYGASGVLTRSDWFLALPVEADDDNFTLFWIPGQDELGNPGVEQGLLRASALKLIYNAKEHFKNGDLNSAIHGFAGALEKDNDFPYIHYVLGSLFAHQNEFSRAEKHLEQAIALEPNLVRARRALVEVYAHQGKQPQAIFHEAYLKKHPVGKPGSQ